MWVMLESSPLTPIQTRTNFRSYGKERNLCVGRFDSGKSYGANVYVCKFPRSETAKNATSCPFLAVFFKILRTKMES